MDNKNGSYSFGGFCCDDENVVQDTQNQGEFRYFDTFAVRHIHPFYILVNL